MPITVDLLLLGFFKYANFGLDASASAGRAWLGSDLSLPTADIILPVGISFYTFHTITYIVDGYRGVITPTRNLFEFAAYVSLFSQLVAGPIVRFRQIERTSRTSARRPDALAPIGVSFFVIGLVEKVLIADTLAAFVDPASPDYGSLSTPAPGWPCSATLPALLRLLRLQQHGGRPRLPVRPADPDQLQFAVQGARPLRLLAPLAHLAVDVPARLPLHPARRQSARRAQTYRNLMLTMLIGGLWHGANWTFVSGARTTACCCACIAVGAVLGRLPRLLGSSACSYWWSSAGCSSGPRTSRWRPTILGRMFLPRPGVAVGDLTAWAIALAIATDWAMAGPNARMTFMRNFRMATAHRSLPGPSRSASVCRSLAAAEARRSSTSSSRTLPDFGEAPVGDRFGCEAGPADGRCGIIHRSVSVVPSTSYSTAPPT